MQFNSDKIRTATGKLLQSLRKCAAALLSIIRAAGGLMKTLAGGLSAIGRKAFESREKLAVCGKKAAAAAGKLAAYGGKAAAASGKLPALGKKLFSGAKKSFATAKTRSASLRKQSRNRERTEMPAPGRDRTETPVPKRNQTDQTAPAAEKDVHQPVLTVPSASSTRKKSEKSCRYKIFHSGACAAGPGTCDRIGETRSGLSPRVSQRRSASAWTKE